MEPCCEAGDGPAPGACPGCGHHGVAVGRITLKALLVPVALARLESGEYRFCPGSGCDVVYFGSGEPFRSADVREPVFQKQLAGTRTVCYCFEVREDRIAHEVAATGTSPSCDRVKRLVGAGRCACEVRNPQGACCLGNVADLVRSAGGILMADSPRRHVV